VARTGKRQWTATGVVSIAFGLVVAGCSSVSPSQYVSPRVTGRVVDADTHQPIQGAQVRRADAAPRARSDATAHGGAGLDDANAVRTDGEGRFVIPSARVLGPFGSAGWYSVAISFERSGYSSVVNTYTLGNSTNTPAGEPWVDAGDVLLPKAGR
jgi:hypothetical protein